MIDDIISMLVSAEKVETAENQIETCAAYLSGLFDNKDSRYKLHEGNWLQDLESSVNLILSPDDSFDSLFEIEDELAEIWYIANGLHHFQMSQIFRWHEAIVLRFVATIYSKSVVTGSIFLVGEQVHKLVEKYEEKFHKLQSWNRDASSARFQKVDMSNRSK